MGMLSQTTADALTLLFSYSGGNNWLNKAIKEMEESLVCQNAKLSFSVL